MTFVAAFHSKSTIWLVADRRLTFRGGRRTDGARKMLLVEASDGDLLIGYAGLGKTAKGTEPSDWMSRVLRGRSLTVDETVGVIAMAMQAQLPKHLRSAAAGSHIAIGAAFVNGQARTYTIDLQIAPDGTVLALKPHYVLAQSGFSLPPRIVLAGSGGVRAKIDAVSARPLFRAAKAFERQKVTASVVADELAGLSARAHAKDRFTGPHCIVAWRLKRVGDKGGGGAHAFYEDGARIGDNAPLPMITRGRDMTAFGAVVGSFMIPQLRAVMDGLTDPGVDAESLNAELAKLPEHPDEKLD